MHVVVVTLGLPIFFGRYVWSFPLRTNFKAKSFPPEAQSKSTTEIHDKFCFQRNVTTVRTTRTLDVESVKLGERICDVNYRRIYFYNTSEH